MKIKELLTDESKWTKGASARNAKGVAIFVDQEDACQFCLTGALQRCYGEGTKLFNEESKKLALAILDITGEDGSRYENPMHAIVYFNDWMATSFNDIRAVIEKADV